MPVAKAEDLTALLAALAGLPADERGATLQEVLAGDQGHFADCQLLGGYRITRRQLDILLGLRTEARETVELVKCLQQTKPRPVVWDDVAFI